jgi:hypothetical protein
MCLCLLNPIEPEIRVQIEVPDEIAAEVAVRIPPDASPSAVDDALRDHIQITPEFVTPDGSDAVEAILDDMLSRSWKTFPGPGPPCYARAREVYSGSVC